MKSNLNIEKSNNKLSYLTTWNKKKMVSLFLMSWLSVNGVESGQGFINCLRETQGGVENNGLVEYNTGYGLEFYNWLLKFPFDSNTEINNGETITFCCDNALAAEKSLNPCSLKAPSLCSSGCCTEKLLCNKFNKSNTIFCGTTESGCGGILGDREISNNDTIGNCNLFTNVGGSKNDSNIYERMELTFRISFADCPLLLKNSSGYASWHCDIGNANKKCHWDNGGWTCFDSFPLNQNLALGNSTNVASNSTCYLQWQTSPDYLNSSLSPSPMTPNSPITTTVLISPSSSIILPSNQPHNNPNLTKKIAIPIATTAGVASVGGIAYLIYKKKKNNSHLPEMKHAIESFESFESFPSDELEYQKEEIIDELEQTNRTEQEQIFQTQIEQPPK